MAVRAIEGKNVLLRALLNGAYVPFVCATSVDFYYDSELIEITTADSPRIKEWRLGLSEWGLTLNTVTTAMTDGDAYTVFDTLEYDIRNDGLDIELSFEDGEGNIKVIAGHVLISHTGISAPEVGFSEDEIEFKGSGVFTVLIRNANGHIRILTNNDIRVLTNDDTRITI